MNGRGFPLVTVLFVLLLEGCAPAELGPTVVVTAATDRFANRLPDFDDADDLEKTLVSFGTCVERSFPIAMRFRKDLFVGMSTEVGSQLKEEGDEVEAVVAECTRQLDLDRRLNLYQVQHFPTASESLALAQGFASCAANISDAVSDLIAQANLDSQDAVMRFISELWPQTSGLTDHELIAVSECESEMTGPRLVFNEGHPWFTP